MNLFLLKDNSEVWAQSMTQINNIVPNAKKMKSSEFVNNLKECGIRYAVYVIDNGRISFTDGASCAVVLDRRMDKKAYMSVLDSNDCILDFLECGNVDDGVANFVEDYKKGDFDKRRYSDRIAEEMEFSNDTAMFIALSIIVDKLALAMISSKSVEVLLICQK